MHLTGSSYRCRLCDGAAANVDQPGLAHCGDARFVQGTSTSVDSEGIKSRVVPFFIYHRGPVHRFLTVQTIHSCVQHTSLVVPDAQSRCVG